MSMINGQISRGTNILDLVIPPQLEESILTGVKWFDDALGGYGLTPSQVCLFTGTPGAGKTTTMLQIADAWTKSGNICLLNTVEEALVQVRKVTKRLGLTSGFICGQDRLVPAALEHFDQLRAANPNKKALIILDSLQVHDDGKYKDGGTNSMTPVRIAEMVSEYCKATYAMTIMIGQVTKGGKFAGKQQLQHNIDSHAHVYIDQRPTSETYGKRIFKFEKNRFGPANMGSILNMTGDGGLIAESPFEGDDDDAAE
jgi:predicted ATP-dependent serine protease